MPLRRILGLLAATAALAVSSCSTVDHGKVLEREHNPMWCSTTLQPAGKGLIPITTCYPENWELRLDDGKDTGWHTVSHDEYERYQVGDTYP